MKKNTINLRDHTILVADANYHFRRIVHSVLRGFGTKSVIEADRMEPLLMVLEQQRVDLLLCDAHLPPYDGFETTLKIRRSVDCFYRTIPILLMTGDTRESQIRKARDSGANMVIAKPIAPRLLYDHLTWIAFHSRPFVDAPNYFGPDRRFKIEGYPGGTGRRSTDKVLEIADEEGPALEQNEIDSLFNAARVGLTP
ncbi:MAG TPA: response regulator [Xanthobacteraceae bacterium]|nr:response regulator [Xanthobacteraceae bacterium]